LNPAYYTGSDKDAKIASVRSQANMIAIWFILIGLAALICWTV